MSYRTSVPPTLLLCLSLVAVPGFTSAQETVTKSGAFNVGSVAMMCTAPTNKEVTDAQFEVALPQWIETLQTMANEGVVKRAHHLGRIKDGIFIIFTGESPQDALNNAVLASYKLSQIFIDATGIQNFNSCTYTQLGPVAVLPQEEQ